MLVLSAYYIRTYKMCGILTKFCFLISKTDLRCSVVSKESLFPGYKEDNKHQYRFSFRLTLVVDIIPHFQ